MSLAIAFGARGKGGALAHFEPGRNVINLTKIKGAGSLAHEWGHALDYFLGTSMGGRMYFTESRCSAGNYPETFKIMTDITNSLRYKECTAEEMFEIVNNNMKRYKERYIKPWFDKHRDKMINNDGHNKAILQDYELEEFNETESKIYSCEANIEALPRLNDIYKKITGRMPDREQRDLLKNAIWWYQSAYKDIENYKKTGEFDSKQRKKTKYYEACLKLDTNRQKPYYATIVEMFARAFESFVEDSARENGFVTQYLVHSTGNSGYESMGMGSPYPAGEEREQFNELFRQLFKAIKIEYYGGKGFPSAWGVRYEQLGNDVYKELKDNKTKVNIAVNTGKISSKDSAETIQRTVANMKTTDAKVIKDISDIENAEDLRTYIRKEVSKLKCYDVQPDYLLKHLYDALVSSGTVVREEVLNRNNCMGNSKAWTVKGGALILNKHEPSSKKCEAMIEAVTRLVMNKVGTGVKVDMVAEGVVLVLCKKCNIMVRTYMHNKNFESLAKSKESIKPYIDQVIKYAVEVSKMLKI